MSPAVLGLETSGTWCSVALTAHGRVHARRLAVGNAHSDHVLDMVAEVLAEAGMLLSDCDAVSFGAGPGSFTGLRIACSVAQGLAFGAGLPVVAIGTLDAIAFGAASESGTATLLVAQDARMGEVYWGVFDVLADVPRPLIAPSLSKAADTGHALADAGFTLPFAVGAGNAWQAHPEALAGVAARIVLREAADAADVAVLGAREFAVGRAIDPADAVPLYVRDRVAETTAERAARRALAAA
jgi:tRNA threonylcarbamoyladenosine biosynthesis protein TsaB